MSVIGVRNTGRRGLKVKVRFPDGSECWLPASWTSLGAAAPDTPRLVGNLPDFVALRNLVCTLAERCGAGHHGVPDTVAAGSARARSTLATMADSAACASETPGGGTGEDDGADGEDGDEG